MMKEYLRDSDRIEKIEMIQRVQSVQNGRKCHFVHSETSIFLKGESLYGYFFMISRKKVSIRGYLIIFLEGTRGTKVYQGSAQSSIFL